jgi:hypothetical protein
MNITYKLKNGIDDKPLCVLKSDGWVLPFDPANTDYANFKEQILANEAELQDADGNTMSSEAAQTFVRGLP